MSPPTIHSGDSTLASFRRSPDTTVHVRVPRPTFQRTLLRVISLVVGAGLVLLGCRIPTTEEAIIADGGVPLTSSTGRSATAESTQSENDTAGEDASDDEGNDDASDARADDLSEQSAPFDTDGLAYSGPGLSSHWHAAYAVRICDELLAPFGSTDDPLGIHSHSDGLIHIHPFFSEAAWADATLGHFVDAMGVELDDGFLRIPGVGEWRDGDMCDGVPARLSVQRWARPTATEPWEELTESMRDARFLHDGEMFTISFAPEGRLPIRPSAAPALLEVSPSLQNGPAEPFVLLPTSPATAQMWVVAAISEPPCAIGQTPGASLRPDSFCYTPASLEIDADDIRSAEAMWINGGPGVKLGLSDQAHGDLNNLIAPHVDSGGIRLAVQVDDRVVLSIALLRPLGDNHLAFVGGMTPEQARTIARLFGSI